MGETFIPHSQKPYFAEDNDKGYSDFMETPSVILVNAKPIVLKALGKIILLCFQINPRFGIVKCNWYRELINFLEFDKWLWLKPTHISIFNNNAVLI